MTTGFRKSDSSLERLHRRRLIRAYLPGGNLRSIEILAADGAAAQTTQHRQLADVGKGVCHWALDQPFDRSLHRATRGQKCIERPQ